MLKKFFPVLTVFLIILLSSKIFPQTYIFSNEMGKFKEASSFTYSPSGFIYVTDAGTNEVYKLDTLGKTIKYAGGYGWDAGLFDVPSAVNANPLSVYVCDKNNHRVERFDKDLNYFWQLTTRNSDTTAQRFGYPLGCTISSQGDLYILDSENKRVVKFDYSGKFQLNFGGYDAGSYSLSNPSGIAISGSNKIFVNDGKQIVVFDEYGSGISTINTPGELKGLNIIFNRLTVNSDSSVYYCDLNSPDILLNKIKLTGLESIPGIVSSLIFNNKLYILTKETILVFFKP